jgi:hypothetical protein
MTAPQKSVDEILDGIKFVILEMNDEYDYVPQSRVRPQRPQLSEEEKRDRRRANYRRYYERNAEKERERQRLRYDADERKAYVEANKERVRETARLCAQRRRGRAMLAALEDLKTQAATESTRKTLEDIIKRPNIHLMRKPELEALQFFVAVEKQQVPCNEIMEIVPPDIKPTNRFLTAEERLEKICGPTIYAEPEL